MKRVTMSGEPTMKRVTMWDATRLSRVTPSLYERQLPQDRDDLLAQEGKRVTKWAQLACHASHISREDWSRRCPVGDLLVDPDQGYLLCRRSPPRALVGQNHHRVISRVCRYTNFAVGDALEHDRNLVGLEQHFARFHGGTLAS